MSINDQPETSAVLREWSESAKYWELHASTIRTMFAPVTQALIEEAGIVSGSRVLDVAGGAGEPSLTIAPVVGPSGSVTCTDAIEQMVNTARNEALRRGYSNLNFRRCEAEALPFENDSFDVVVSRLGAMFFSDPEAAIKEMLRVLKSGGAVSLVVWSRSDRNPFSSAVSNVVGRYVPKTPDSECIHDAFRFAERDALASIFRTAGAFDVKERAFQFHIAAPISFAEFWAMRSATSGSLRDKLATLSPEERSQIAKEVELAAKEFFPNNQMRFPAEMLIVSAGKNPKES